MAHEQPARNVDRCSSVSPWVVHIYLNVLRRGIVNRYVFVKQQWDLSLKHVHVRI
jgi:hypothetical protein